MIFNLSGLHGVFVEAIKRHEPTIAFPLANGLGRFSFLLFIPTSSKGEIKWGDIELFIILGRTQRILRFDLTGNHYHKGVFNIAVKHSDEQAIRLELGIDNAEHGNFSLNGLLTALNAAMPLSLPLEEKIACMQDNRDLIKANCGKHIDSASRIYLLRIQPVKMPAKPREETLRKLYMLSNDKSTIIQLIRCLKERNWTVAWTDRRPDGDKFLEIWQKAFSQ